MYRLNERLDDGHFYCRLVLCRYGSTSDEKVLCINYVDFIEVVMVFVVIIREELVCVKTGL